MSNINEYACMNLVAGEVVIIYSANFLFKDFHMVYCIPSRLHTSCFHCVVCTHAPVYRHMLSLYTQLCAHMYLFTLCSLYTIGTGSNINLGSSN